MKILPICPPHLSDVATLAWEIQKKSLTTVLVIYLEVVPVVIVVVVVVVVI